MSNNEKMNDNEFRHMRGEQERREQFMVDDDREKPDRLPDDESEYLEGREKLEEDDDDAILSRDAVDALSQDHIGAAQQSTDVFDEHVPPDADEFDETYSDAILPEELDSEDLERIREDEKELLDDEPRASQQLGEDDGLEDGDLPSAERRFITLSGESSELDGA